MSQSLVFRGRRFAAKLVPDGNSNRDLPCSNTLRPLLLQSEFSCPPSRSGARKLSAFTGSERVLSELLLLHFCFGLLLVPASERHFVQDKPPASSTIWITFIPGVLVMIVLFTAIFTMMSVIEDRNEGFLLSVMVAPVPRAAIVLGKVLGGTTLATVQGLIFLIFAPFVGVHLTLASFGLVVLTVFLVSFALTALGLRYRLAHGFDAGLSRSH